MMLIFLLPKRSERITVLRMLAVAVGLSGIVVVSLQKLGSSDHRCRMSNAYHLTEQHWTYVSSTELGALLPIFLSFAQQRPRAAHQVALRCSSWNECHVLANVSFLLSVRSALSGQLQGHSSCVRPEFLWLSHRPCLICELRLQPSSLWIPGTLHLLLRPLVQGKIPRCGRLAEEV